MTLVLYDLFSCLDKISRAVELTREDDKISEFHVSVRHHLGDTLGANVDAVTIYLLRISDHLIRMTTSELTPLINGSRASSQLGLSGSLARHDAESPERRVDLLTGVWLGMYFLGLPFNDPWDRARQIIDDLGGYPAGACFNKAIGDVYRSTRQVFLREIRPKNGELTILTRYAIELVPVDAHPMSPLMHEAIHRLGRHYAWLQLRLYTREHLPLRYYVREDDWLALSAKVGKALDAAKSYLQRSQESNPGMGLFEIASNLVAATPDCYLGYRGGMYSLGAGPTRLEGNRISRILADSYRERLHEARGEPIRWDAHHDVS